jgi:hypothetical protein
MRRVEIASVAATQPRAPVARWQPPHPYPASARFLLRYIEGWAEADIAKIVDAVSADYSFLDPLVGSFRRDSLADYLAVLRERVGFGSVRNQRCKVYIGAFRSPGWPAPELRFWRALPECGLAGTSDITMRAGRVSREVVCYEPTIAVERLRGSA